MEKLTKMEYGILYYSARGRTSLEKFKDLGRDESEIISLIKRLNSLKLLEIEYRDDKIYGFLPTKKGEELLESSSYRRWFNAFGH